MKNLRVFTIALCAMALAVGGTSCKKDNKQIAGERMVIGASINQGGGNGAKTHVGDLQDEEFPVLWDENDQFNLYSASGATPQTFTITEGAGTTSATFEGVDPGEAPYFGFYPAGEETIDDEYFMYEIPAIQTGKCENAPMFGYSEDGQNIAFTNVMSWVKLGLKGNGEHVTSVKLSTPDLEPLGGTLKIYRNKDISLNLDYLCKDILTANTDLTLSEDEVQYVSFLVPSIECEALNFTIEVDGEMRCYKKVFDNIASNTVYEGEISVSDEKPTYILKSIKVDLSEGYVYDFSTAFEEAGIDDSYPNFYNGFSDESDWRHLHSFVSETTTGGFDVLCFFKNADGKYVWSISGPYCSTLAELFYYFLPELSYEKDAIVYFPITRESEKQKIKEKQKPNGTAKAAKRKGRGARCVPLSFFVGRVWNLCASRI